MDRFDSCWPFVLFEECRVPPHLDGSWVLQNWSSIRNYSDDPRDRGGATMCGIIQREYDHYRKGANAQTQPVRLCSEAEGHWIYYSWYWLPNCPNLPAGLDLSFFDSSVNQGTTEAIRILQVALGVANDGVWGPAITAAIAKADPVTAINSFAARRQAVYHLTHGFDTFGRDWLARTERIRKASLDAI